MPFWESLSSTSALFRRAELLRKRDCWGVTTFSTPGMTPGVEKVSAKVAGILENMAFSPPQKGQKAN